VNPLRERESGSNMDPLRHNCTQLYERLYIWRDTVGLKKNDSDHSPLSATLSFPTDPSLSFNIVPEEKKLSGAGPLNHSIGLEEDRWKAEGIW
jgi:hypothetical protein